MAHESFEDQQVADLMNERFVNIKVDREERPDIDDIYQRVCQLASGTGGWPLSVFLTPDQKPFYVGTYFPKDGGRYGMPGFPAILTQLSDAYKNRRSEIEAASLEFMRALADTSRDISPGAASSQLSRSILDEAAVSLLQMGDSIYGGFGQAPKFPNPTNLMFLLRYYDLSGISRFRDFVLFACDKMAAGGIFDHLGGGFSRYSTDQKWLVPHFEKMLYDNALMVQLYAEVYQVTKREEYLSVVRRTLDFLLREMAHPEGGFYSAIDADSEGVEGKFYVWSKSEIEQVLADTAKAKLFCDYYGVTDAGNFEGKNILNVRTPLAALATKYGLTEDHVSDILSQSRKALYEYRAKRTPPSRDEKVLVSWNGLAISAFVKGYQTTSDPRYLDAARKAVDFIERRLSSKVGNGLYHSFKDGIARNAAYLDDYAFLVGSLIDVFSIDPSIRYLDLATRLADLMLERFWDPTEGSFYFTSEDHERLIIRTKNFYDLAVPSGNSMAAYNLSRLYQITGQQKYLTHSEKVMEAGGKAAAENPFGFGQLLISIYLYVKKPVEIALVAKAAHGPMARWLSGTFLPSAVIVCASVEQIRSLQNLAFFKGRAASDASETAYVCRDFTCSLPITELDRLNKELEVR